MTRAPAVSHIPSPPNPTTQLSESWRGISETVEQAQDAQRFAVGSQEEVKLLGKEISQLKIILESSSRQIDSTHDLNLRPYGCTFMGCSKTFDHKTECKQHENSQHFHLEMWRCDNATREADECDKVCYCRETFNGHLKEAHQLDDDAVKAKTALCRIGRNARGRFWCCFCTKLIDLTGRGVDAWTERLNHIDDHFMGRRGLA